jgi:hypothetical protein
MWSMDIPQFMNIGEFCKYTGLSRWHFMRLRDKHHLPMRPRGTAMLVEVEPAIKALATVPGIEMLMSAQGMELISQVQEEQAETQYAAE